MSTIFLPLTVLTGMWGMNVPLPHFPGGAAAQFWWVVGIMVGDAGRRRCWRVFPHATTLDAESDLDGQDSRGFRPTSPIRSPPARSSSGRRRSSRSWSRTPSTPARARIAITVELGGKKLIRVEDDGEGMEPDDARLAIERHATSKIRHVRRPRAHRDARLPRRGAAEHRLGLALHAADARARRGRRAPRSASTAARSRRSREVGHARGHVDRSAPTCSTTCRRAASS